MKYGLYRNNLGAELNIIRWVPSVSLYRTLGDLYEAISYGPELKATYYLVTEEGLREAGYLPVEEDN